MTVRQAAIYARYSDRKQREESIEDQLKVCNDFAKREGYKVIKEYCDYAMSGRSDDRVAFQRMIRDSATLGIKAVIVYKLDRFARDRFDTATYRRKLKANGVRVVSATECIPDTPEGIILESVMEGMAEWYSANLSQNVKRGMKGNAERCLANGVKLFGYKTGTDGRFEIDTLTAPYVCEAFRRYNAGTPQIEIARWLNESGMKTTFKNEWSQTSIRALLNNQKYAGVYKFGDVTIDGGIPSIVTKEEFYMANHNRTRSKSRPSEYNLTGKLFCQCGSPMIAAAGTSRNGTVHHYYHCQDAVKHKCGSKRIRVADMEKMVIEGSRVLLRDSATFDAVLDSLVRFCDSQADRDLVRGIERNKRQVEHRIKNLIDLLADVGKDDALLAKLNSSREELEVIDMSLSAERQKSNIIPADFIEFVLEKARDLDTSDVDECARFLVNFVSRVTVGNEYLTIEFHYKDEHGRSFMLDYPCSRKNVLVRDIGFEPTTSTV